MADKQGWWWPMNSRVAHFFPENDPHRSLCGKWMKLNDAALEDNSHDSPDNCAACKRAREQQREARNVSGN